MNPNDYDFWSVGNEQLSLQNHFPKHIPSISFLTHSGADSPTESNSISNTYTCAEPEILRTQLESALQCAHDEIEKYQLTLNENTAKKLLEATAQGAFKDDPNIRKAQMNNQRPKEYRQSKLRLMELFIPPIKEEESTDVLFDEQQTPTTPKAMLKSPSFDRENKTTTPTILSSSMFQPPTSEENNRPPLFNESSKKPPMVPLKNSNKPINKSDEVLTKDREEKLAERQPKQKSQSFSCPSGTSYTENEESVTTIKSNVNDELLKLLNKYYPAKTNSNEEVHSTGISTEEIQKSNEEINKTKANPIPAASVEVEKEKEDKEDNSSTSSSSDSEKENVLEDSFLPSSVSKKSNKLSNNNNSDIHKSNTIAVSTPSKFSKKEDSQVSQPSIGSTNTSESTKSKTIKHKQKKNRIKNIFSPIHRIFNNNNSSQGTVKSSKKSKSVESINKVGTPVETNTNSNDSVDDESKYKCEEVLGKGANAVVKLAKSSYTGNIKNLDNEKFYAIKQFRKRRKNEPYKAYIKKVISEFCISSSLKHQNVVETVDLIQDKNENWCEVMEYCSGGDLYTRINTGTLTNKDEINCYFKQLLTGVAYLHSVGVCHRDLKPENLLMDETGTILKITDFGVSEVFRFPWEKNVIKRVTGLCGSEPYIAPEEWSQDKDYDPIKVDIWACAIVFYTMNHMSVPWRQANSNDKYYEYYLNHITNFGPIEELPQITHEVLYHMLDPNPETRWPMEKVIESEWIQGVTACGGEAYKGKGNCVSGDGHVHTSRWKV